METTRHTSVADMHKMRKGVQYPDELVGQPEDKQHEQEFINKKDPLKGKKLRKEGIFLAKNPDGGGRLKAEGYAGVDDKKISDASQENSFTEPLSQEEIKFLKERYGEEYIPQGNEDELLEAIDRKTAAEKDLAKAKLAKKILNFIENNEKQFKYYRNYFAYQQAYSKDKTMLEAKLADNQNINNPRQRVNAEALQEELTRMSDYLSRFKNNLHIDDLPLDKELVEKIVSLPAEKLQAFKERLISAIEKETQDKSKEGAEKNLAA